MTITVKENNGIRYGEFEIHGIKGTFPRQIITSTNLYQAEDFEKPKFDFKTNIAEIIEFKPKKLVNDSDYRDYRKKKVSKMINENPDKLWLFTLKGARTSSFKMNKDDNESLIKFQIECGFKLIKTFFRTTKFALENSRYYRTIIPERCTFVASLDENLNHAIFRELYLECCEKNKDEIICFFGRIPSKKSSKNIHNKLNFEFVSQRLDEKVIRVTSFAPKSIDGAVSSIIFNWFRFDLYSFITRRGNPDIPDYELKALNQFLYEPLTKDTKLICPITQKNLYDSSQDFKNKYGKSSLPVSVHDIVRLNEIFTVLHEEFSREQLEKILGKRIP